MGAERRLSCRRVCATSEPVPPIDPACLLRSPVMFLCLRCASLYEQDEANVFAEPSVMSVHVLPHLLQMAENTSQSSSSAQSLSSWAEENVAQVLDSLAVCEQLLPGTTVIICL